MKFRIGHLFCLILTTLIILLNSCGGNNGNSRNPSTITYTMANGTVLVVPISQLSVMSGNNTSTSISAIGGAPGIHVLYSSNVTTTNPHQSVAVSQNDNLPVVTILPPDFISGHISTSTINVVTSSLVAPGTYYIQLMVTYTYNGTLYHQEIGVMQITISSNPSPTPILGTLSLTPESLSLNAGESSSIVLTLNNSFEITNLTVNLAPESSIISVNPSNCTLSTESNTCIITLIAGINQSGATQIIASATNYDSASSLVTIIPVNIWTWVGGESSANNPGVYGIKGQPSESTIPGARTLSYSWTDNSGNFWLYGGLGVSESNSGLLSDLWQYNVTTHEWTWVSGESTLNESPIYGDKGIPNDANIPGSRIYGTSWRDNNGNLWLLGGLMVSSFGILNDLWKYNIATNKWTWMSGESSSFGLPNYGTKGVPSESNVPGGRVGGIGWVDESNNLWLFGGLGVGSESLGSLNDLWKYNITTNEWTWVSGESINDSAGNYGTKGTASVLNIPAGRPGSSAFKDHSGNLWLFGGGKVLLGGPSYNDLWKYNLTTNEWTWMSGESTTNSPGIYGNKGVANPNNMPRARNMAIGWSDNANNLWLFSGLFSQESSLNDLWKYNLTTNEWTWMSGTDSINESGAYGTLGVPSYSNIPGARFGSVGWIDSSYNLWLLGGLGYGYAESDSGALNDFWMYKPN